MISLSVDYFAFRTSQTISALVCKYAKILNFSINQSQTHPTFAFSPSTPAADALNFTAIFLFVFIIMVTPNVRDVLGKQHDEDEILIFCRIHCATESVAGFLENAVNFFLGYGGAILSIGRH